MIRVIVLALAAAFFAAIHVLNAPVLRPALIPRIGENAYRGVFSGLSLIGVIGIAATYKVAPYVVLYQPPSWGIHVTHTLMVFAFLLLAFSISPANATMSGMTDGKTELPPARGVFRITRHPMLSAFTLWGIAHLFVNGHVAALLLVSAVLIVSLNGMRSIDGKLRARLRGAYDRYVAETSRLPFGAILGGRNRLVLSELPLWRVAAAIAAYIGAMYAHGLLPV